MTGKKKDAQLGHYYILLTHYLSPSRCTDRHTRLSPNWANLAFSDFCYDNQIKDKLKYFHASTFNPTEQVP